MLMFLMMRHLVAGVLYVLRKRVLWGWCVLFESLWHPDKLSLPLDGFFAAAKACRFLQRYFRFSGTKLAPSVLKNLFFVMWKCSQDKPYCRVGKTWWGRCAVCSKRPWYLLLPILVLDEKTIEGWTVRTMSNRSFRCSRYGLPLQLPQIPFVLWHE